MMETKKSNPLVFKRIFPVVCSAINLLTIFLKKEKRVQ